jgi:hypothetical protein
MCKNKSGACSCGCSSRGSKAAKQMATSHSLVPATTQASSGYSKKSDFVESTSSGSGYSKKSSNLPAEIEPIAVDVEVLEPEYIEEGRGVPRVDYTGSIVAGAAFAFTLLIAAWRERKKKQIT